MFVKKSIFSKLFTNIFGETFFLVKIMEAIIFLGRTIFFLKLWAKLNILPSIWVKF